jgi:lysophospholipase L1-like esterase
MIRTALTLILVSCCFLPLQAADTVLPVNVFKHLRAGTPQTVVTYGTSLTANGPWVKMLAPWFEARYPGLVTVVNSGGSGQHSGWGITNVQEKVVAKHPDLVFIEFGINDAHVRFKLTPEQTQKNLDDILVAIRTGNREVDIILMTMNCAMDANGKTAATDRPQLTAYYDNYRTTAAQKNLPFIDLYPLWCAVAEKDPQQFLSLAPDGLHPTGTGIKTVTWPHIEAMLTAADAAAAKP